MRRWSHFGRTLSIPIVMWSTAALVAGLLHAWTLVGGYGGFAAVADCRAAPVGSSMKLRWAILIAAALVSPSLIDSAYASPPPSKVVSLLTSERGVLGARCAVVPPRDKAPTYLCVVRVRSGCVSALFQIRHGQLGWYRSSARPAKCWRNPGGPTA